MLVCVRLTLIRFFLADSIALRMACGTSLALPEPWPTTAADGSPTTTSAAKERFLPPLTTLVTRLMATTWSLSWYEPASSFFMTVGILNSRFLCRLLAGRASPPLRRAPPRLAQPRRLWLRDFLEL